MNLIRNHTKLEASITKKILNYEFDESLKTRESVEKKGATPAKATAELLPVL